MSQVVHARAERPRRTCGLVRRNGDDQAHLAGSDSPASQLVHEAPDEGPGQVEVVEDEQPGRIPFGAAQGAQQVDRAVHQAVGAVDGIAAHALVQRHLVGQRAGAVLLPQPRTCLGQDHAQLVMVARQEVAGAALQGRQALAQQLVEAVPRPAAVEVAGDVAREDSLAFGGAAQSPQGGLALGPALRGQDRRAPTEVGK